MLRLLALLVTLWAVPAQAQNFIQIPACGNSLPASVRPSAPTITMNPSGQVCISGNFSVSVVTPLSINIPQVSAVVSGAFADGALVTLGQVGEAAYKTVNTSGDVIALLKGIFANVMTPISVTGAAGGTTTTVNINSITPTPLNVTMASPINVTGNFTAASPNAVNIASSPINVTLAASPLNVTGNFSVGASPQSVLVVSTPLNVTLAGPTPLNMTLVNSPVGVTITSSPVNVTGNFTSARAVTNNNWNPGTSNNGMIALPVTLMTTELQSLAANSVTISSVNGTSGVFSNANFIQAVWAVCQLNVGNPGVAGPGAGANISVWFAPSYDGATFEIITQATTVGQIARPPDAIFPLGGQAATTSPSQFAAAGLVRLPPNKFKVVAANNAANTLGTGAQTAPNITCAPVAVEN